MGNFLCFDLGTSKIKSAMVSDSGRILYFSEKMARTYDDGKLIYQKPEDYYNIVLEAIHKMRNKLPYDFKEVNCVICSGQMGGVLGIDEDWNVEFPWSYSVDKGYVKYLSEIEQRLGKEIRQKSGGTPTMAGKILWIRNEFPEAYKKINKFINLAGYVSGKICGLKAAQAFIDYSCLTMAGLADIQQNIWDSEICKKVGCDINNLPKIVRPYEVVGYIRKDVFGTKEDIKVLGGCGDQVAGFIGSGVIKSRDIVDVAGTYHVLGYCTDRYVADTKNEIVHSIYSGISDLYYQIAIVSVGGYTYKWFVEHFGYYNNKKLENLEVEPTQNLYFVPHLGGRISPSQPYFRGAWIGIEWSHDLNSFYSSLLEANGYELHYLLEIIRNLNGLTHSSFSEIKVIGGGAENKIENQIKANILNLKYIKPNNLPFEILGDFLIAKYQENVREGYGELLKNGVVWEEYVIKPEPEKVNIYNEKKKKYTKIISNLEELFHEIGN